MTLATHMKNEHSLRFLHQSGLTVDQFISVTVNAKQKHLGCKKSARPRKTSD